MNLDALRCICYGLYVVTSKNDKKYNGQIVNTIFQVASQPITLAVSINKQNLTCEYLNISKVFATSVLAKNTPLTFISRFGFRSGREIDKFEDVNFRIGITGVPIILDNTIAWLEAKIMNKVDFQSHTVFFGEVIDSCVLEEGEPMTYDYYRLVKRGGVPKTAPTYVRT